MKILYILSDPSSQAIVERNAPTWPTSGADVIFGVEHEDKPPMRWPGAIVPLRIGTDPDRLPHRWVTRFLKVLEHFAGNPWDGDRARWGCLIEGDTIFVSALKTPIRVGFYGVLAGGRSDGFRGDHFFHCPWLFDSYTALYLRRFSERMLRAGLDEQGFVDRFLGLMDLLYGEGMDFMALPGWYSANTIITPNEIGAAQLAIEHGQWAVHGVKTQEVFDALKGAQ